MQARLTPALACFCSGAAAARETANPRLETMSKGAALAPPRTQKFFSILPPDMVIGLQGRQGLPGLQVVQSLRAADLRGTQLTDAAARNEAGSTNLDCVY